MSQLPSEIPDAAAAQLLRDLARAVDGLVYSSESDRPFEPFFLRPPAPVDSLTGSDLAGLVGAPRTEPVETLSLDRFLSRHIEMVDPLDLPARQRLPRYDALRQLLAARLRDVRVFRIGRVQVRCYVVGLTAAGDIAGIQTVAIET